MGRGGGDNDSQISPIGSIVFGSLVLNSDITGEQTVMFQIRHLQLLL